MAVSSIKEVVNILAEAKLASTGNVLTINGDLIEWAPVSVTQGPAGANGVGIASADIVGGNLLITNTLGGVLNAGVVVPTVKSVASIQMDVTGTITATYSDGSTQTVGNVVADAYTKAQLDAKLNLLVELADVGVANGVASLDDNGKVPVSQLPPLQVGSYSDFIVVNNFMELLTHEPFPTGTAVFTKQDAKLYVFVGQNYQNSADYVQMGTATGGSQLPAPYSFTVNPGDEALVLNKASKPISFWKKGTYNEMLELVGDLFVGSGVVYFGGNHTISDAGNALIVTNENRKMHATMLNQSASDDGSLLGPATARFFRAWENGIEPNGALTAGVVNGEYTLDVVDNYAIFGSEFVAGENIVGQVKIEVRTPSGRLLWSVRTVGDSFQPGSVIKTVPGHHFYGYVGDSYVTSVREVVSDRIVKLKAGTTDTTKPYRKQVRRLWDNRLVVVADENGKIDSSFLDVAAVARKTVANQAARLALPKVNKLYIVIQTDTSRLYYLDENLDPAVTGNWVDGGSTAAAVASFNGRVGAVVPQTGDYTAADVGALSVPPADGQRRVLYGSTPTVEELATNYANKPGQYANLVPATLQLAQDLNNRIIDLNDRYFDEAEIRAFANDEAHKEFDIKFTGIDTEIDLLKKNSGSGSGVKPWKLDEAYGKDVVVFHMGSFFASNSIIPISTPFSIHASDVNAWRPISGALWNTVSPDSEKVFETTATDTIVQSANAKSSIKLMNNQFRIQHNNTQLTMSDTVVQANLIGVDKLVFNATSSKLAFNTSNNLDITTNSGILKIANFDVLSCTGTNTLLAYDVNNKLDIKLNVAQLTSAGQVRLDVGNSFSALQSGSGSVTQFKLTGDTTAILTVNGIKKMDVTSTGASQFRANDNNYLETNIAGTFLLKAGANNFIEVAGASNQYLYLRGAGTDNGKIALGPNVVQFQLGNTERLRIDGVQSNLNLDATNYLSIQSNRAFFSVNNVIRLDISPANNYSRLSFDGSHYMEAWSDGCKFRAGGLDRIWANGTVSSMRSPDTNTYLTLNNTSAQIYAGSVERFSGDSSSSKISYSGTKYILVNSSGPYAQFDNSNYFFHNGNFVVGVGGSTKLDIGSSLTKIQQAMEVNGGINPTNTNSVGLGSDNKRWSTVYAQNAFNAASDRTLKENIISLPDALLDAWGNHVAPKQYNWIDKTTSDKNHIGFIAQDIIAAFDEAGLDWKKYSIISGDGVEVKFGVSYTDAHVIETAYQRRKIAQLEEMIKKLK